MRKRSVAQLLNICIGGVFVLAKDLFEKIGFSDDMVELYQNHRAIYGDSADHFAREYMCEGKDYDLACSEMKAKAPQINEYIANMVFVIECTGYAHEDFKKRNISDEIFYNTMSDITCKMRECKSVYGVYGSYVPSRWYNGIFKGDCLALGRLQYELWDHREDDIEIYGFKIEKGYKTLSCHIPSSGPLTHELVVESLKMAYEVFADRIKDGILAVECFSWLLFPNYRTIFKECAKNTYSFAQNFTIYDTYPHEKFYDAFRIYGVEAKDLVVENLPENTRMQKGFKEYLKNNNEFGGARGVLLFDGENILTRK